MNAVVSWVEAHPVIFAVVIWPLVTGIVTSVLRKPTAEEYARMNPRVAALRRFIAAIGLDVPKVLETIHLGVTGRSPTDAKRDDVPPTPRNVPPLPTIFMFISIACVAVLSCFACGCSPAASKTAVDEVTIHAEVTGYNAELGVCRKGARAAFDACVARNEDKRQCKAKALESFDACGCVVDKKYKVEGGVCQ